MKYVTTSTSDGSVAINEIEPLALISIGCKGTTLATAQIVPVASPFAKIIIFAQYIDGTNDAFVFPVNGLVFALTEVDVFVAGPNGSSVTMFLPSGSIFNDGSTSISIPCGVGKKFMIIGNNTATVIGKIVGVMG